MNLQRLPPYSEEAEIGVLGSILLDSVRILDMCMEFGLTVEDFHVPAHQKILMAIGTMASNNKVVDVLTVAEKLKSNGDLEKIGGSSFIDRLVDDTPTVHHCQYYLEIIKKKTLLRNIIRSAQEIENDAYQSDNPEELRSKAETMFTKLQSNSDTKTLAEVFDKVAKDIEDGMSGKPIDLGISTEYETLDSAAGGLGPGVHWLTGKPASGKTSLKNNIIMRQILNNKAVASLTLEMTMEQEIHKLLSVYTDSDIRKIISGKNRNWPGLSKISGARDLMVNSGLFHETDQRKITNTEQFKSWARRMVTKFGVKLICVDYLQKLNPPSHLGHMKMEEKTTFLAEEVTAIAGMLGIPILCLAAENDNGEVRGSRMADYEGTTHWRLEKVGETGAAPDYVRDILATNRKARFGPDDGKVTLKLYGATGIVREPSKADEYGLEEQTDFIDNPE